MAASADAPLQVPFLFLYTPAPDNKAEIPLDFLEHAGRGRPG